MAPRARPPMHLIGDSRQTPLEATVHARPWPAHPGLLWLLGVYTEANYYVVITGVGRLAQAVHRALPKILNPPIQRPILTAMRFRLVVTSPSPMAFFFWRRSPWFISIARCPDQHASPAGKQPTSMSPGFHPLDGRFVPSGGIRRTVIPELKNNSQIQEIHRTVLDLMGRDDLQGQSS